MKTIRALRKDLKEMRDADEIDATTYRKLYKMAKGGAFRSKSYMKTYARDHDLIKQEELKWHKDQIIKYHSEGEEKEKLITAQGLN